MTDSAWTEARIGELIRLHGQGRSAAEIARAMGGVSRSAVLGKIHRLGIQKGRPTRQAVRTKARQARGVAPIRPPLPFQRSTVRVISPRPVGFLDLPDEGACRFPVHEEDAPFLFCGNGCPTNRSYCPGHHEIAYDRERTEQAAAVHAQRVRDWLTGHAPRPGRVQSTRPR